MTKHEKSVMIAEILLKNGGYATDVDDDHGNK